MQSSSSKQELRQPATPMRSGSPSSTRASAAATLQKLSSIRSKLADKMTAVPSTPQQPPDPSSPRVLTATPSQLFQQILAETAETPKPTPKPQTRSQPMSAHAQALAAKLKDKPSTLMKPTASFSAKTTDESPPRRPLVASSSRDSSSPSSPRSTPTPRSAPPTKPTKKQPSESAFPSQDVYGGLSALISNGQVDETLGSLVQEYGSKIREMKGLLQQNHEESEARLEAVMSEFDRERKEMQEKCRNAEMRAAMLQTEVDGYKTNLDQRIREAEELVLMESVQHEQKMRSQMEAEMANKIAAVSGESERRIADFKRQAEEDRTRHLELLRAEYNQKFLDVKDQFQKEMQRVKEHEKESGIEPYQRLEREKRAVEDQLEKLNQLQAYTVKDLESTRQALEQVKERQQAEMDSTLALLKQEKKEALQKQKDEFEVVRTELERAITQLQEKALAQKRDFEEYELKLHQEYRTKIDSLNGVLITVQQAKSDLESRVRSLQILLEETRRERDILAQEKERHGEALVHLEEEHIAERNVLESKLEEMMEESARRIAELINENEKLAQAHDENSALQQSVQQLEGLWDKKMGSVVDDLKKKHEKELKTLKASILRLKVLQDSQLSESAEATGVDGMASEFSSLKLDKPTSSSADAARLAALEQQLQEMQRREQEMVAREGEKDRKINALKSSLQQMTAQRRAPSELYTGSVASAGYPPSPYQPAPTQPGPMYH